MDCGIGRISFRPVRIELRFDLLLQGCVMHDSKAIVPEALDLFFDQ